MIFISWFCSFRSFPSARAPDLYHGGSATIIIQVLLIRQVISTKKHSPGSVISSIIPVHGCWYAVSNVKNLISDGRAADLSRQCHFHPRRPYKVSIISACSSKWIKVSQLVFPDILVLHMELYQCRSGLQTWNNSTYHCWVSPFHRACKVILTERLLYLNPRKQVHSSTTTQNLSVLHSVQDFWPIQPL